MARYKMATEAATRMPEAAFSIQGTSTLDGERPASTKGA
jgi:hypothetical protein